MRLIQGRWKRPYQYHVDFDPNNQQTIFLNRKRSAQILEQFRPWAPPRFLGIDISTDLLASQLCLEGEFRFRNGSEQTNQDLINVDHDTVDIVEIITCLHKQVSLAHLNSELGGECVSQLRKIANDARPVYFDLDDNEGRNAWYSYSDGAMCDLPTSFRMRRAVHFRDLDGVDFLAYSGRILPAGPNNCDQLNAIARFILQSIVRWHQAKKWRIRCKYQIDKLSVSRTIARLQELGYQKPRSP